LFRNYPFDQLSYFNDYYEPGDYDANSEDWYTNVAGISPTDDNVIFTAPYIDPVGLVISMGRPVRYDNESLIGVVSADVTMGTVLDNVLNLDVSTNGYAFLLDSNGDVVAHPNQPLDDEDVALIETLEFGTAGSSEATTFRSLLNTHVLVEDFGLVEYTKDNTDWHLSFVNIPNTDYILLVVVPDSDVIAPATEILNLVATRTLILVGVLGGILALVGAVVSVVSSRRGEAVVEPIREMTRLVNKMAKQDFTRGVTTGGAMYEEVGTTVDALLSFQEACRFGNQAFIRGDLRRALANYQNLLEISKRLQIEEGEQTMLLNIGNVFRQRGDTGNSMDYYNQSLEISNRLLERAKEDGADEKDAMMRIASTYHNMALVEMDRGNADKAMTLLEDAEAIDIIIKNSYGLARRYDAMGLVLMRDGKYSQAQSRFNEAQKTAKSIGYERSLAYIHYHEGELYQVQGKWKKMWLVVFAMQKLADVLDQLNKPSHDVRRKSERLKRSILFKKSVTFVIDYSGSMQAQQRIKAAVRGAKEILHSQVNPQDAVSIIIFNSSYREILPLTIKGDRADDDSRIVKALDSLKYPNYATAFYDALGRALEELNKIESSEHRWIIALTDGQDNSSKTYSLDALEGIVTEKDRIKRKRPLTIEGFIRDNHLDVNLIVIGVGQELANPVDTRKKLRSRKTGRKMTTEELLESICESIPQGQYLSVVDSADVKMDIERAFEKIGVLMAQLEVGGTTVDY